MTLPISPAMIEAAAVAISKRLSLRPTQDDYHTEAKAALEAAFIQWDAEIEVLADAMMKETTT